MITRRFQGTIDATKKSRACMLDLGHLAVNRCRAHHLAAERLSNGLMTETDTEYRRGRRGFVDEFEADAGLIRCAWSGRKHNGIRPRGHHLGNGNLVVAVHGNVCPKLSRQWKRLKVKLS